MISDNNLLRIRFLHQGKEVPESQLESKIQVNTLVLVPHVYFAEDFFSEISLPFNGLVAVAGINTGDNSSPFYKAKYTVSQVGDELIALLKKFQVSNLLTFDASCYYLFASLANGSKLPSSLHSIIFNNATNPLGASHHAKNLLGKGLLKPTYIHTMTLTLLAEATSTLLTSIGLIDEAPPHILDSPASKHLYYSDQAPVNLKENINKKVLPKYLLGAFMKPGVTQSNLSKIHTQLNEIDTYFLLGEENLVISEKDYWEIIELILGKIDLTKKPFLRVPLNPHVPSRAEHIQELNKVLKTIIKE